MRDADDSAPSVPQSPQTALKVVTLGLAVAVAGLPVNTIAIYAMLVIAAILTFSGRVRINPQAWGAAAAIVVVGIGAQTAFAPPRIDEGFNVFLPGGALERELPPDVYRFMSADDNVDDPLVRRRREHVIGLRRAVAVEERDFTLFVLGQNGRHKAASSTAISARTMRCPAPICRDFRAG